MDYKKVLAKIKKGSGDNVDYLKFEDGDTVIRLVPGHPNMDGFFISIPMHQKNANGGGDYLKVICLDLGEDSGSCEICPDIEPLRLSDDKADKKLYKEQMAKDRFFFSAVVREDDGKGGIKKEVTEPKVAECGTMLLEEILTLLVNPEYEDLLDPITGLDVTVNKSGEGMKTEYKVTPRRKSSMIYPGNQEATEALIGTGAEDTKLKDLNTLKEQFSAPEDRHKPFLIWQKGWKALKDDSKEDTTEKPKDKVKPSAGTQAKKTIAKVEEPVEEAEESVDITSFPKLKSRCAVCGDPRFKVPTGATCAAGHGGKQLPDDERPSKPSKAYLKEFPEPVEEEVEEAEEVEEEEEPLPTKTSTKTSPKPTSKSVEPDGDDGLEELSAILEAHGQKAKK